MLSQRLTYTPCFARQDATKSKGERIITVSGVTFPSKMNTLDLDRFRLDKKLAATANKEPAGSGSTSHESEKKNKPAVRKQLSRAHKKIADLEDIGRAAEEGLNAGHPQISPPSVLRLAGDLGDW